MVWIQKTPLFSWGGRGGGKGRRKSVWELMPLGFRLIGQVDHFGPFFLSANSFSAPIDDLRASSTHLQVLEISNTDSLADSFSNPQTATVYLIV